MKRIVSVWLPEFAIDRFRRHLRAAFPGQAQGVQGDRVPFALTVKDGQALLIKAANRTARKAGVAPGQALADAFAVIPSLQTRPHERARDRQALEGLARWAVRYAPVTATDGEDGLWLDVTGAAHLSGGEQDLLENLATRLAQNGFENQLAMAPTPGAAWALARFQTTARARFADTKPAHPICACDEEALATMLAPLPVEALRLAEGDARLLRRFGLKTIGQVMALPRAALARRFPTPQQGMSVLYRLDQVLGHLADPIAPYLPEQVFEARLHFAEPCLMAAGILATVERLLAELCTALQAAGKGARGVTLHLCRVDASALAFHVRTRKALRNPHHLMRLLAPKLENIDAGFGIDAVHVRATRIEPLATEQEKLTAPEMAAVRARKALDELADRLINRLGEDAVFTLAAAESHIPERSERARNFGTTAKHKLPSSPAPEATPPRPLRLFDPPHPIDVVATLPGFAPQSFRWRRITHRLAAVRGPERIESEWWHAPTAHPVVRDYYDVEDVCGHRFWIFHSRVPAAAQEDQGKTEDNTTRGRWCLHGVFS